MGAMNRRDVMKRAVGLAGAGAGGFAAGSAVGQEPKPPASTPRLGRHYELPTAPDDPMLERAIERPFAFMFVAEAAFEVGADNAGQEVVFPTGRNAWNPAAEVRLRSSSLVVFRADGGRDEFTRRGGVYWSCGTAEGKFRFDRSEELDGAVGGKPRGPLVLAVRDRAGTVRCYHLLTDYRC